MFKYRLVIISIMEALINKKSKIKKKIHKLRKKLFDLENELYEIEKSQAKFSCGDLLESMTLSQQQKEVVFSEADNILVVACPGSGKTHTLISRYIYLVSTNKIDPEETILITFTKKSGMEMNERLSRLIPTSLPEYVGSLHGLCYRVLQKNKNINYSVLDEKDSRSLIREIIDSDTEVDDEIKALIRSKIISLIEVASTRYPFNLRKVAEANNLKSYYSLINNYYKEYMRKKKAMKLLDFSDLLVMFCDFLKTKKGKEYLQSVKYIFFDEYQDINPIQNYILSQIKTHANIMVVGDDAQAIYAFRGSSVEYIWDFPQQFKPCQKYFLETNYRSTPTIVNFCQDVISHNTKQFEKKVIANEKEKGVKPKIMGFQNEKEQYLFIVKDIQEKISNGVKLKDMVILSRKNMNLNRIELYLMSANISVVKSLGISLLNKRHVKDFLAFITVLVNDKSYIHWKRILALHPKIGLIRANRIIDMDSPIIQSINNFIINEQKLKPILTPLLELFNELNQDNLSNFEKTRKIIDYLQIIWMINKEKKIEEKIEDLKSLTMHLNESNLVDFVNDLYLNKEMDANIDNCIFLSSVHGVKGLEYDYVYLIDFNSSQFPCVRPKFYLDEFNEMEEERRLFYVAASRAKKYLFLSYHFDHHPNATILVSPFIREMNPDNYINVDNELIPVKKQGIISKDVVNYLRLIGFKNIQKILKNVDYQLINLGCYFDIPDHFLKSNKKIIGNMIDFLISKILHNHFSKLVKKFDLPLVHRYSDFPQNVYHKFLDPLEDWRNMLDNIYYIATYGIKNKEVVELFKTLLLSEKAYKYFLLLEKKLIKWIKKCNPKEIRLHYNLTHGKIKAEADILLLGEKNHLIEIKSSCYQVATLSNLTQTLLYGFLLNKKDIKVDIISIMNPLDGIIYNFTNDKLLNICKSVKKLIY